MSACKGRVGIRMADRTDASSWLLDCEEREQFERMCALKAGITWQEPHPEGPTPDLRTMDDCLRDWGRRALCPETVLRDGTRGRYLRQEWPDQDYPREPPEFPETGAGQLGLF
jgi:hypothetical protein